MGIRPALLIALATACTHCGGEPEVDTSACGEVCDTYRGLGCEEGEPTPDGAECEEICELMLTEGLSVPAECIIDSATCDEARACEGPLP